MNWFKSLFFKAASAAVRFMPKWVRYSFLPVSWARLLEGYQKNSAVSACVTALAFSFPEAPLLAGREVNGRFVPEYGHQIMALIRQPNPDMGEVELMQFAVTYASIGGNLYLWKQRAQNGKVIALWPFSDAQITPVPGQSTADGFVKAYELDPGDGQTITIQKRDMIQWKWMPDPEQPWRGIGALEFAIRDADRDTEASSYIYALLKNNAVPPVVVTLAEGDDFDEDKADRMRAQWWQKLGGENAGNVAFIEYGMKAEKMGFNLQELAAEALNAVPEARIAAAFRVPPVVAGLSVGLKRSDYGDQAARRSFTELTLAALWRSLASELYNGLKDDFSLPNDFTLQFDLRKVRALQEEETKVWERVTLAFNRSVITRAEAKEYMGLQPNKGDYVYFVSLASEFVRADGDGVVERNQLSAVSGQQTKGNPPVAYGDIPPNGPAGNLGGDEWKALKAQMGGALLRRIRLDVARRMKQAVDVYFSQLADSVITRASSKSLTTKDTKDAKEEQKKLPKAEELVTPEDGKKLETLVKRYYVEILELSWDTWNYILGVEKAFDLTDPAVTEILKMAGLRVKDINAETLKELRDALQYANENGWSIDQLIRGDETQRGLRDIVNETYKGRAENIARTELGEAQNGATVKRYGEAGIGLVEILDNGGTDDDAECQTANGQIWTLGYFASHMLEHPSCTRAAAPYFGDAKPDKE